MCKWYYLPYFNLHVMWMQLATFLLIKIHCRKLCKVVDKGLFEKIGSMHKHFCLLEGWMQGGRITLL